MDNITPKQFLNTLFPHDLLLPDERPVVAYPDSFISSQTGEDVQYYRQFHPRGPIPEGRSTYFCLSTVERQRKRQVKKRLEDVRTAFALVVDDVGTKSKWPRIDYSYCLETSHRNYQIGWLIEPFDVSTPDGQAYFDSCLWSLAEAGYNDPGFRSASRLARLPGSVHKSGFIARLKSWHPDRVWALEDLMAAFAVPMAKPRKIQALKPGKHDCLEDVDDPVYDWLVDNWTVYGNNDQWVFIECPWRDSHTDEAQGSSSTAYSPMDYGRAGVGFKCLHGHCARRGVDDFMSEILRRRNNA